MFMHCAFDQEVSMVKYSREPENPIKAAKARASDLRVHFKVRIFRNGHNCSSCVRASSHVCRQGTAVAIEGDSGWNSSRDQTMLVAEAAGWHW
jgi:hypothetical protein